MLQDFLNGEISISITKEEKYLLDELNKILDDITFVDGDPVNSSSFKEVLDRYEYVYLIIGYSFKKKCHIYYGVRNFPSNCISLTEIVEQNRFNKLNISETDIELILR